VAAARSFFRAKNQLYGKKPAKPAQLMDFNNALLYARRGIGPPSNSRAITVSFSSPEIGVIVAYIGLLHALTPARSALGKSSYHCG
jgi:hypothetical protein